MTSMRAEVRITIPGSTTYLVGRAVLPRLTLLLFGVVFLRGVQAGDVFDYSGLVNPVKARWMAVPKTSIETMAVMEEDNGTA